MRSPFAGRGSTTAAADPSWVRTAAAATVVVGALSFGLPGCGTPAGGGTAAAVGDTAAPVDPSKKDLGHNLALLDLYCWRLELNKNTDYTILAKASEGGIADASIYVTGTSWAEVVRKAVEALEADMAARGITPDEAKAHNGGTSFTEAEIKKLTERYNLIDAKAWYFKAVKTQGWTITTKADIGAIASVTAMGEGPTLVAAVNDSLRKLDEEIAKRK